MSDCHFHVVISKNIVLYLYQKHWKNLQQSRPFSDSFQNIKKCKYISLDIRKFRPICVRNVLKSLDLNLEKMKNAEMVSCCLTLFHGARRRHKGACNKFRIKANPGHVQLLRYVRTGVFGWLADFDVFIQLLIFNPFIACFSLVS